MTLVAENKEEAEAEVAGGEVAMQTTGILFLHEDFHQIYMCTK